MKAVSEILIFIPMVLLGSGMLLVIIEVARRVNDDE